MVCGRCGLPGRASIKSRELRKPLIYKDKTPALTRFPKQNMEGFAISAA